MKDGEARIADDLADVSVLFSDLVGFTGLATRVGARELLDLLDRIFSTFDQLADAHGLEKVKTIGDAYMAVGGALAASPDHLERSIRMGLDMLRAVERLGMEGAPGLAIRIGLHAGPAVAGVIGKRRLNYDLWGETVNLASRLESSGVPGRIHVSESVATRLAGAFTLEPRGVVAIKGLGEMRTFLVATP
jgi:class 3 adenylate cyclase